MLRHDVHVANEKIRKFEEREAKELQEWIDEMKKIGHKFEWRRSDEGTLQNRWRDLGECEWVDCPGELPGLDF